MDSQSVDMLEKIENTLCDLLEGKQCDLIEINSPKYEIRKIATHLNHLIRNLNEMNQLASNLSQGKLDVPLPRRHNYMSSPLKQLHSRLSALTWSCEQLQFGYVVSKLDDTGELFRTINGLIDQVATGFMQETNSINSWRYHQILQTSELLHIMIIEVDESGNVVYANRCAKDTLGSIKNINSQNNHNKIVNIIAANKKESHFPITSEVFEDNESIWYRVTTDRFLSINGHALYFSTIENINEWKLKEIKLKISASLDKMTSTYNRNAGLEELELALTQTKKYEKNCIAFIDLDGLKEINDKYGHCEGDFAIKSIAEVMLSTVRDSDIVCRYGGDEFFIIFKNCSKAVAKKIIFRVYEKLNTKAYRSKPYKLSFSYGLVTFSHEFKNATDLIKLADEKMYLNKRSKTVRQMSTKHVSKEQ
ncbi:MAG: sensor domain-containing diguanylate cyclase [Candidatus Fimivivens sp.]|nr:sensor domain-containing diguanylate cyclase [Candidatus Fimivivens sp.]